MRRVEREALIDATPEAAFAFISDLEQLPRWQTGMAGARLTSEGPLGVGATAIVVRELMGQRMEAPLRITAYDPPRTLAVQTTLSGVTALGILGLEPVGGGTRLTFAMEIRASGFARFAEPMLASTAANEIEASLRRLQKHFTTTDR